MTNRGIAAIVATIIAAVAVASILFVVLPRVYFSPPAAPAKVIAAASPAGQGRKIKAQLFYVDDDGARLIGVEREVAFAETPIAQAREILNAQFAGVEPPLVSAVPPGTALRALFLTDGGQAFVDLSRDVSVAHPGGSLNELLTIYTVVHALTFNLPAISAVQLLVDGREVDTLAGHVDLRRPLSKNLQFTNQN